MLSSGCSTSSPRTACATGSVRNKEPSFNLKTNGFSKPIIKAIDEGKILGIRAGTEPHRIIGIWAVVVKGQVFVRSWSLKPRSWYRTFLNDPVGVIRVLEREIAVRAVFTRSERMKAAVDEAYRQKYTSPGELRFVADMCQGECRDSTTQLVPQ